MASFSSKPDYGVDAPYVMRNMFVAGGLALALIFVTPAMLHLGQVDLDLHSSLAWMGSFVLAGACMFLLYVKWGKFRHRDRMLRIANLRGDERVLDVGCGRGLLLAGVAKQLNTGQAVGLDLWSNKDMGGNSAAATEHNLKLEGITDRCTLVDGSAQAMPFADDSFDAVLSNLCLHNIDDRAIRRVALDEVARVLKPGGVAILSDYKNVGEYSAVLSKPGWKIETRWGNPLWTFPPLRMVIAHKPLAAAIGGAK